jgi:hypothetical protein
MEMVSIAASKTRQRKKKSLMMTNRQAIVEQFAMPISR